jgi:hypothetical protein
MAYLHVEDFRRGQDTRRSAFTAPPGSLRKCMNAHITRGGEVEKRLAFAVVADDLPSDVFGLHVLQGQLIVFGSAFDVDLPPTVQYLRLEHPRGTPMVRLLDSRNFNGKVYAVAEFEDGSVHHYYDGVRVSAWDTLSRGIADLTGVASILANQMEGVGYTTSTQGNVITVTGPENDVPFSFEASESINHEVIQEATDSQPQIVRFTVAGDEFNRPTGGFRITDGPGEVNSIQVDSWAVYVGSVEWDGGAQTTAQKVVDAINGFTSGAHLFEARWRPEYPDRVIITATDDGLVLLEHGVLSVTTSGELVIADEDDLQPGREYAGGFNASETYRITLDGEDFLIQGLSAGVGRAILPFRNKVYSVAQSLLYFTGFSGFPPAADATAWGTENTGAGFINLSTQDAGAESLIGMGVYQDRLVVFGRSGVQLWHVDPDPDRYEMLQVLSGLGTFAPRTIKAYGNGSQDVFFLSDSGVRSLRARDSSMFANAEDVGSPVDQELVEYLATLSLDERSRAVSGIEPAHGRYFLAVGARFYVFSHFPGSDIRAWSSYDMGAPIEDIATEADRLYVRAGDKILRYGGNQGNEYGADYQVEVQTPFMDMDNPGADKHLHSLDVGCEGVWSIYLHPDPTRPNVGEYLGTVDGSTFGLQPRFPVLGNGTHFSLRFVHQESGPAKLTSLILHYDTGEIG